LPGSTGSDTPTVPGKKPWASIIDVAPGGAATTVSIPELLPDEPPALPLPPPPQSPAAPAAAADAPPSMPRLRVAALVTGAGGVAGIGAGAVLGIVAIARKSDAGCAGTVCPDSAHAEKLTTAKGLADGSTAAFVAGGALVAGAAAMWLLAPTARVQVGRLEVRPALGGILIDARF
jgi:hypothetical protein